MTRTKRPKGAKIVKNCNVILITPILPRVLFGARAGTVRPAPTLITVVIYLFIYFIIYFFIPHYNKIQKVQSVSTHK